MLLVVELYSSKVDVYPMCSRKKVLQKTGQHYDEIKHKRNKKNMNNVVSKKCGYSPNDIEKKFLASKKVRTLFNFHRIVQRKKYTINSINTIEKNTNQKRKNCTKIWRLMKRY